MSVKALNGNGFNHFNQNNLHIINPMTEPSGALNKLIMPSVFNTASFDPKQFININDSIETTFEEANKKMSVVNISDLVEKYAYKFFKENERDFLKKIGKNINWKEVHKDISFKNLRVRHEKPIYQDIEKPGNPLTHILFRSSFCNDTDKEQEYLLRTERKTVSTCDIEIFQGYVTEHSAELSLDIPIPGCVASAGAGFKHEYSIENSTCKSIQEEMTWSLESNVRVSSMSQTTAELLVRENQYRGAFEIKTYFSGGIRIKLFKDNLEVLTFDLDDLDDIFTADKGFKRDNKGIFCITKGECKARFGIEQKIQLHQQPIAKN